MRISDWSSDVCSSDLALRRDAYPHRRVCAVEFQRGEALPPDRGGLLLDADLCDLAGHLALDVAHHGLQLRVGLVGEGDAPAEEVDAGRPNPVIGDARLAAQPPVGEIGRATSELQSLMRISYAVFCLKKKNKLH